MFLTMDIDMPRPSRGGGGGETALHAAAREGDIGLVTHLCDSNPTMIAQPNSTGDLPLHLAMRNGHVHVALFLFDRYPRTSLFPNHQSEYPLFLAVESGDTSLVDFMLRRLSGAADVIFGLQETKSIVRAAVESRNSGMLGTILGQQRGLISSHDEEGLSPLSRAVRCGHLPIIDYMMISFSLAECNIRDRNRDESYPIHQACIARNNNDNNNNNNHNNNNVNIQIIQRFYDRLGGRIGYARNRLGQTILHVGVNNGNHRLVSYLLGLPLPDVECFINLPDIEGLTAFQLATQMGNRRVLQAFNSAGYY